jgi:maleylacetoacetate isomerase/maleylpyruvate isomerase
LKLYSYFRSSTSYRVRIGLNLKGLAYEQAAVNLLKAEQSGAAYRAVNPQGRVPSLDLGNDILIQSPAILEYLEEAYPEPPLLPKDPVERSRIRAVCAVIACDIHPLNNSGSLNFLKNRLGQDQAAVDSWFSHWVHEGLRTVETLMEPGPYAFGDQVTLADVYIVPQVFNARRFNIPLDAYPKVLAVDATCAALPAFAEAAPARQPDAA